MLRFWQFTRLNLRPHISQTVQCPSRNTLLTLPCTNIFTFDTNIFLLLTQIFLNFDTNRNTLLTLPCSDFIEDGCASLRSTINNKPQWSQKNNFWVKIYLFFFLRSSASYCVRCVFTCLATNCQIKSFLNQFLFKMANKRFFWCNFLLKCQTKVFFDAIFFKMSVRWSAILGSLCHQWGW